MELTESDRQTIRENIQALRRFAASERASGLTDHADVLDRLAEKWSLKAGDRPSPGPNTGSVTTAAGEVDSQS